MAGFVNLLLRSISPTRVFLARGFIISANLLTLPWICKDRSAFTAAASTRAKMAETRLLENIIKSPLDTRNYRAIELGNKMRVLLISDPTTDLSAAALSVAAGSMHDPAHIQGLAHFCEHMLFLGTEKYPEENEYTKFLSENAGGSNAYTGRDHTCYFFDIAPKVLDGALDRFAQFFICPLFTECGTEREVNAVNSEHEKNIPQDMWRLHQLEVILSDPNHAYNKFATGNRETLWDTPRTNNVDVRGALLEFHKTAYSANLMNLAVIGKQSLDELQTMVESKFVHVPNKDIPLPRWDQNPYGPNQLRKWVKIVPVKDVRQLQILFPIPCTTEMYKTGSESYISNLIGHEGPGSLLSLLKENHWVNSLSAGATTLTRGASVYRVTVDLTPDGMKNMEEIIFHFFQYLALLKSTGPLEWLWQESGDLGKVFFRFKDKEGPQSIVAEVAAGLHDYPIQDVLSHQYLTTEYKPELITNILSSMTPQQCMILSVSKDFESVADKEVPYYGAKYSAETIPEELLQKWSACELHEKLKLPEPNAFIPRAFDLKPREENRGIIPRVIKDTPLTRAWFLQDNEFELPKGVVIAEIYSPRPLLDARAANLNALFTHAVKDILTEASYAASLAGLNYDILPSCYGIEITTSGYDHKLEVLLKMLMEKMVNFKLEEERFAVMKDLHLRKLKNFQEEQPYQQAVVYMTHLLREHSFTVKDLLEVASDLTLSDLHTYVPVFLSDLKFNFFVHGNFTTQEAQKLISDCETCFTDKGTKHLLPSQVIRSREVNLPVGTNHVMRSPHPTHSDSCTAVLYQTGVDATRENVLLELVDSVANEPCFTQLRTQEQLGYIVMCHVRRECGTHGIRILVQSNRSPTYVEERIEVFLRNFTATVENMTDEDFIQHRNGLLIKKEEKPKTLTSRSAKIWMEISNQQFEFDRQALEVAELKTVGRKEFVEYFQKYIAPDAPSRKRVSVQIVSMKSPEKNETTTETVPPVEVTCVADWKKGQTYYPVSEYKDKTSESNKSKL